MINNDFILKEEEVSGIVKVELNDFFELWLGKRETIKLKGFEINIDGNKILIDENVGKSKCVFTKFHFIKQLSKK